MHRFMDDLLENIQEAERRAAIFDALDEDEVDEEDEEMLRIEMPDWRLHLRNFEWRVRGARVVEMGMRMMAHDGRLSLFCDM